MALLTHNQLDVAAGTAPVFVAAAAGGDTVQADASGRLFVVVKNASAGAVTVTVVDPRISEAGVAIGDPTYSVGVAGERWIPIESFFRDPATGLVNITYSAVASVTVAAVRR